MAFWTSHVVARIYFPFVVVGYISQHSKTNLISLIYLSFHQEALQINYCYPLFFDTPSDFFGFQQLQQHKNYINTMGTSNNLNMNTWVVSLLHSSFFT
jgi:hypothetical protein